MLAYRWPDLLSFFTQFVDAGEQVPPGVVMPDITKVCPEHWPTFANDIAGALVPLGPDLQVRSFKCVICCAHIVIIRSLL